jgi:hypothetical protein
MHRFYENVQQKKRNTVSLERQTVWPIGVMYEQDNFNMEMRHQAYIRTRYCDVYTYC